MGAAAVGLSCEPGAGGRGGTGVVEPAAIEATVTADGAPRSGVSVRLFEPDARSELTSAVTGSAGTVIFSNLGAGAYEVEVDVPADFDLAANELARKAVAVPAGQVATVSFGLVSIPTGGTVEVTLDYPELTFSPADLTVGRGTTVRWRNAADVYHTITPEGHTEWQRVEVDRTDQTFSHTFHTVGDFPYLCEPHTQMTGSITVR